MKKTTVVRLILSAGLIYGVFTETGWFTAIAITLMTIYTEVAGLLNRPRRDGVERTLL